LVELYATIESPHVRHPPPAFGFAQLRFVAYTTVSFPDPFTAIAGDIALYPWVAFHPGSPVGALHPAPPFVDARKWTEIGSTPPGIGVELFAMSSYAT
jgi:hypothetical protein